MSELKFYFGEKVLENSLVRLEIFNPDIHTKYFLQAVKNCPQVFAYIDFPDCNNEEEFRDNFFNKWFRNSAENCLWAVVDKTTPDGIGGNGSFAGLISLDSASESKASTAIGVIIMPAFQRTHVTSNALGLVLLWTLDPPLTTTGDDNSRVADDVSGGLGLRRVEWTTDAANAASRRAALRMGFEFEGILRWNRVCKNGQQGLSADALRTRNGTKEELRGRHTATFSIVWEEWNEKRPVVIAQMLRGQTRLGH